MKTTNNNLVIFTDLDATLLDQNTYSFKPAKDALTLIRRRDIPLILCTSKTRQETSIYWKRLRLVYPYIVEDGAAIIVPDNYFDIIPKRAISIDKNTRVIMLDNEREKILKVIRYLKKRTKGAVCGISQMKPEMIANLTGLPLKEAQLASQREFSEPFIFLRDKTRYEHLVFSTAKIARLRILKGARFYHLHGNYNKGKAVSLLIKLLKKRIPGFKTIGLGDSLIDLSFLLKVDIPVVIRKIDGSYNPDLKRRLPDAFFSPFPGPAGWNHAILKLLHFP